jgi:peptidoglycan biosynthesis protein MviN/MurJ (putative lipid II flippase)
VLGLGLNLGLAGIGLAIAIGAWIEALILLAILRARAADLSLRPLGLVALRAVAATVAAVAVTLPLAGALRIIGPDAPSRLETTLLMLVAGSVGLAVYLGLAAALRIPELPSIVGVMADLLRRPRRA